MGFFDIINPFSYVTPVYADDGETEEVEVAAETTAIASESAEAPAKEQDSEPAFVASDPVEVDSTDEETVVEEEAEEEAVEEEEEEEEEDPVDPAEAIKAACAETLSCKSLKHHYEECVARVNDGSKESCAEEFLHLMHCIDKCAVPQIFAKLK
ncbi:ubiquinol--cytochrome-c reductase subunit 6 [Coemansia aciculifera]|uniref:Ubiquinol--cytochrome-c reductase subunit 6 n=1 Tax=Coemansia aciculifera TaxID=417176 RepID=A0ACC1M7B8_9FUNG|nr:ubiquinol--cytochrome-c reductase subunit 6 [Coemansia aciculifera]